MQTLDPKKELEIKKKLRELKERKVKLETEIMPELAKTDYATYVEYVHQGAYQHAKHTKLICKKLQAVEEGKIKRLMIFLPPGHSKSQTCTESFPSYCIGRNPERRILEASYGDDLAWDFGAKNKKKIEEFGKQLFNIEIADDMQAKGYWGIKNHIGYMYSGGIRTGITGKRGEIIIIDDPHKNREEADSQAIREQIWKEFTDTIESRDVQNTAIILIMTRWHVDDLAGRILKRDGTDKWTVISLPLEAEANDPLGRAIGEPLWPENYNKEWMLAKKKTAPERTWNSLYQQKPTIEGGNLFKSNEFRYYNERPADFEEEIHSWDFTFKDKADNDFVVGGAWGVRNNCLYLLDRVKARMDFSASLEAFEGLCKKWPKAGIKLIEGKANGPAIISALKYKIGGITEVEPKGSKYARAEAVTPLLKAHRVYLPSVDIAPWITDYIQTLEGFPSAEHDDDVDMTSQVLQRYLYLLYEEPKEEDSIGEEEEEEDEQGGTWFD